MIHMRKKTPRFQNSISKIFANLSRFMVRDSTAKVFGAVTMARGLAGALCAKSAGGESG